MHRFIVASAITAIALLAPGWATASNKETAQHIAKTLKQSGRLHNFDLGVKFKDGTAWLIGRVASEEQKTLATEMVESLPEVSTVVNELEVSAAQSSGKQTAQLIGFVAGKTQTPRQPVVRAATPRGMRSGSTDDDVLAAAPTVDSQFQVTAGELEMDRDGQPDQLKPMTRNNAAPRNAQRRRKNTSSARTASRGQGAAAQAGPRALPPFQQDGGDQNGPRGSQRQQIQLIPMVQGPNGQLIPFRPMQGAQPAVQQTAGQSAPRKFRRRPFGFRTASTRMPTMDQQNGGPGGPGGPMPAYSPNSNAGAAPTTYDQPHMPNYSWPSYASYPNYAGLTYPKQYSPTAWPYIGPFYPYPQVPLGWRKVSLEWDDGWWFLDFDDFNGH